MENMSESIDEIMIHYASIGGVIMFNEWDHPTSGQVDKWTSGWVHNNGGIMNHDFIHACDEFLHQEFPLSWVSVLLHHQIQFNSIQFNSILW
jgi:hypothetical protein